MLSQHSSDSSYVEEHQLRVRGFGFLLTVLSAYVFIVFLLIDNCFLCFVKIYRESTGTTSVNDKGYGDAVQKAEAMAFRRACARLGLGLHLYHEDAL